MRKPLITKTKTKRATKKVGNDYALGDCRTGRQIGLAAGMSFRQATAFTHIRRLYRELEAGWSRMRDDAIDDRLTELETKIAESFPTNWRGIHERRALACINES